MRQPITSLPSLNCFRAAAEFESFSAAADQLNLTHGAVSRAVRLLEDDLGAALFERRNRRVFLTENGRRLARAVDEGFARIEQAIADIRQNEAGVPVTLSCEPTLLMRYLIPRLPDFQERFPDITLQLVAGGGPVRLDTNIQFAIRRNDFSIPNRYRTAELFDEEIGPVCRADLVELFFESGQLKPEAPCLHTRTRPQAWTQWSEMTGARRADFAGQYFEHFYFSLQAAVAGLGVAIGPRRQVQDDIESGLLAAPTGFTKDGSRYVLLSERSSPPGRVEKALLSWLGETSR